MIKMILHPGAAFFAEGALPDLTGILLILKILLSDTEGHIRISAFHGKIGGKGIVSVYDDFHFRRHLHGFFQKIHGNVDLTVPVQLVPEEIGQHHVIRLEMWKNPDCRSLVHLDAGIVCLQIAA